MAYVSGQHGSLQLQGATVIKVRDWSINLQHEPLDATTLGDKDRVRTHGLRTYSGSGTLLYYEEANATNNIQAVLTDTFHEHSGQGSPNDPAWGQRADEPDAPLKLKLQADNGVIELFVYMTSVNITCATGEIVQAAFSFESTGAPIDISF